MDSLRPRIADSILVIVDIQPGFMKAIDRGEEILRRAQFLTQVAHILGVPVLATEQAPGKLGPLDPSLVASLSLPPISKNSFGCCECFPFMRALSTYGARKQAILIGIESHICMSQTALGLLDAGYRVAFCPDATSARSSARHTDGVTRMVQAGAAPIHTEGVAYEWMGTADHPKFRDVIELVKSFSS